MGPQAAISHGCCDCNDGLVWWLGHQLSLATLAVAGKEGNGGGKEALESHSHTHACAHTNRRQERQRNSFGSRLLILFRDTCSFPT